MVETSQQPNLARSSSFYASQNYLGGMFVGDEFRPIYKARMSEGPTAGSSSNSLFTIDSILAPTRPKPSVVPSQQQRTIFPHPTFNLGHLGGFGASSADFLGESTQEFITRFHNSIHFLKIL